MRKLMCLAMGAAMLFPLALSACSKEETKRSRYTIDAEYFPEERRLSAEMTVDVVNTTEVPLDEILFELWGNAYREGAKYAPVSDLFSRTAYYAGKSYGSVSVRGMTGAAGFEVRGEDDNILAAKLSSPIKKGESATLGVSFDVRLANISHRLGVTRETVNLANFYPVLCEMTESGFREYVYASSGDPFVSACADYDVTLTVPEGLTVATGAAAKETREGGKTTFAIAAENVRDIAFVLGDFKSVTTDADGVEVVYYYQKDSAPETTLKAAAESLCYFSEKFGGYAYPRYALAETDLVYGGMEFPAFSMISSSLAKSETPTAVVHETAHQWWYAMVGSNQFDHAWQDEGLAEYSCALFFGENEEYGETYRSAVERSERAYRAYFSVHSQVDGTADTAMDRPLTAYSGDYEYRNVAYDKGVILFDRIREVAGEKKLFSALKRYKEKYEGSVATPDDLISCFESAGANVRPLFASFTEGMCVI